MPENPPTIVGKSEFPPYKGPGSRDEPLPEGLSYAQRVLNKVNPTQVPKGEVRKAVLQEYIPGSDEHVVMGAATAQEAIAAFADHYARMGQGQTCVAVSPGVIGTGEKRELVWLPIPQGIGQANSALRHERGKLIEERNNLQADIAAGETMLRATRKERDALRRENNSLNYTIIDQAREIERLQNLSLGEFIALWRQKRKERRELARIQRDIAAEKSEDAEF